MTQNQINIITLGSTFLTGCVSRILTSSSVEVNPDSLCLIAARLSSVSEGTLSPRFSSSALVVFRSCLTVWKKAMVANVQWVCRPKPSDKADKCSVSIINVFCFGPYCKQLSVTRQKLIKKSRMHSVLPPAPSFSYADPRQPLGNPQPPARPSRPSWRNQEICKWKNKMYSLMLWDIKYSLQNLNWWK